MSSEKRGTIGSFALLGMTVAAVFGIKNIINNNAAIGLAAAPSFFFATLLYFVLIYPGYRRVRRPQQGLRVWRVRMG